MSSLAEMNMSGAAMKVDAVMVLAIISVCKPILFCFNQFFLLTKVKGGLYLFSDLSMSLNDLFIYIDFETR